MSNGSSAAYSGGTTGFWTNLITGLGDFFPAAGPLRATKPNPGAQVLVAQNVGAVYDSASPSGSSNVDLWYDPISSVPGTPQSIVGYETVVVKDPYGQTDQFGNVKQTTIQKPIYGPRMYTVKSTEQDYSQQGFPKAQESILFRSPEAATLARTPCDPASSEVAATVNERMNRLTNNQFLSPFRARRAGGNSYQALSDAADEIFSPTGSPGNFSAERLPVFVQSGKSLRLPRGR